jgi:hypothetical protein
LYQETSLLFYVPLKPQIIKKLLTEKEDSWTDEEEEGNQMTKAQAMKRQQQMKAVTIASIL